MLNCFNKPSKNNIGKHLAVLRRNLDLYTSFYENIIVVGDLNLAKNPFASLMDYTPHQRTCYKNDAIKIS